MDFKDYYAILGVSKGASKDEIRKAFRKLARQYHPDVAKDKATADQKFKEINEAYEVLGDEEKRRKYDQLGSEWQRPQGQRQPQWQQWSTAGAKGPSARGYRFDGTGFSDFFEEFFGSGGRFSGFGGGSAGADPFTRAGSAGRSARKSASTFDDFPVRGADVEGDIAVTLEEVMNGAVRDVTLSRTNRQGVEEKETFKVRIPAGVREGQRLRVPGKGDPGMGSGEAGNLFLNVRYAPHPLFRLQDDRLVEDVELAPWEAVLGARVRVETLDGSVNVKIPAGTQAGTQMRVRGRGLPLKDGTRGDLLLSIVIAVPRHVSEDEKALWQQLADRSSYRPRE